jgi:thioredoxin reductase/bacterioferritin-associated ferredoxin
LKEPQLIVIGSGPGGMAAAIEAARVGVKTLILDENPKPGGRIYWQFNEGFKIKDEKVLGPDYPRGIELLNEVEKHSANIEYLDNAVVLGFFDNRVFIYQRGDEGLTLRYDKLVVATGAYDRPVAFPGWTLPGVFTAGGAQTLVKMQRVLPGKKVLFAGTGPLQLVVANQVIAAGGDVVAVLEAGDIEQWFKLVKGFWRNWDYLKDGWNYLKGIRKAGVELMRKHLIVEVRGDDCVEEALIAEVDDEWRPKKGALRSLKVDAVCIGYGLIPSVEITRQIGCKQNYEPKVGGWIPVRGKNMETSVPGVYAVGDGAGVAGSAVANLEGRIAGIAAASSLGSIGAKEVEKRLKPFRDKLERITRLREVLDEISMPRPGLYELATDSTVICRCEEITLGEIKQIVRDGVEDINEIKRLTRMGMGRCQGRMCAPLVQEVIARMIGIPPAEVGYLNQRPPVKPVPLAVLASLPGEVEMRHGW